MSADPSQELPMDPKTALVTQVVQLGLPQEKLTQILLDDRPSKFHCLAQFNKTLDTSKRKSLPRAETNACTKRVIYSVFDGIQNVLCGVRIGCRPISVVALLSVVQH